MLLFQCCFLLSIYGEAHDMNRHVAFVPQEKNQHYAILYLALYLVWQCFNEPIFIVKSKWAAQILYKYNQISRSES